MKKCLFFMALMMNIVFVFAQKTNLIFFSEGGERFYVILNGVLQNQKPETNVKVTDLTAPYYKMKILFKDSTIAPIEKNLMYKQGTETTFNIKKNNNNEYVVRYLSEIPIEQSVPPTSDQKVVIYSASGPAMPVSTTTVSTTQTVTSTAGNQNAAGVSMGVNVDGVNMNINVNAPSGIVNNASTSTTYSTTTTTTTTTNAVPTTQAQPQMQEQQEYVMPGYSGPRGCHHPMSQADFETLKSSISSKSFEDSKLAIAKQVVESNCLLASQVKEVMMLFSFEDSKLDFAKYAYTRTFDTGNYFKVNDAFTFESSISALTTYISGIHK